ncbi:uncharacterized protein HGUI_02318 [Hanseniaspora guilliermondii]|uniref:Serine/threonine-protein phosphatase 4 regulatory subunit 3-like central domain-containing protein n=1 Tax=Hanseniaspora guilliermondii TaxID=56406 RepID=A0A1L0FKK8_9ASCO|nr:uncharacterized protein HGUI_02318 [Hanseniaspora guilliermondii]
MEMKKNEQKEEVPMLIEPKPLINNNFIESESEFYITTDSETDDNKEYHPDNRDTAYDSKMEPTTPETDKIDGIFSDNEIEPMTMKKRVKVYFLENGDWRDVGTGYVSGIKKFPHEELEHNSNDEEIQPFLLVVDENSPSDSIIMSQLEGDIEYQRQEETLIVWRDCSGKDIALSFEEISGCDHICDFIKHIQSDLVPGISLIAIRGDINNLEVDSLQQNMSNAYSNNLIGNNNINNNFVELLAGPVALPSTELNQTLTELIASLKIINDNMNQPFMKSKTQKFILDKDYMTCLINNFNLNKTNKDWQKLILISSILKSILAYNESYIIYRILENDLFESCLEILEYDIDNPTMKANYVDLYQDFKIKAQRKQEIWFHDEALKVLSKNREASEDSSSEPSSLLSEEENDEAENCKFLVGQLARLTFLRDVVFARYIDDFHAIQDVLQEDQTLLLDFITKKLNILDNIVSEISTKYKTQQLTIDEVLQNMKMLHECILMAKSALGNHTEDSLDFMQKLVDIKIFEMLKIVFTGLSTTTSENESQAQSLEELKTLATDISLAIIENDIMSLKDECGTITSLSAAYMADRCAGEKDDTENDLVDLSMISVLANLLIKDKCQYLKPQLVHALLALLSTGGSTGVEDFFTQSLSNIDYKVTEIIDDENDFYTDKEEDEEFDDDIQKEDELDADDENKDKENNNNIALMGKTGALSMFVKQINNIDDEDDLENSKVNENVDMEEFEEASLEEDIVVDEEDEKFYENQLMNIADENDDYNMENNEIETGNFNLDKYVAMFGNSDEQHEFDQSEFYEEDCDDTSDYQSTIRTKFLTLFYDQIASPLIAPILNLDLPAFENNNLIYLFDIVKFMIYEHKDTSREFILKSEHSILVKISEIMRHSKTSFRIKIKCMKLFTTIISFNDSEYIGHIISENLLDGVFEIFREYGHVNGMIKSIILDFCKLMNDMNDDKLNVTAQDNFSALGEYIYERFLPTILEVVQDKEYTVLKRFIDVSKNVFEKLNVTENTSGIIKRIEAEQIDEVMV